MALHRSQAEGEVHIPNNWTFADATARLAATGFSAADVGKLAYDIASGNYYRLQTASPPTWAALGAGVAKGPGSSAENVIQASGDFVPLSLKAASTQTSPLLQLLNASGGTLADLSGDGRTLRFPIRAGHTYRAVMQHDAPNGNWDLDYNMQQAGAEPTGDGILLRLQAGTLWLYTRQANATLRERLRINPDQVLTATGLLQLVPFSSTNILFQGFNSDLSDQQFRIQNFTMGIGRLGGGFGTGPATFSAYAHDAAAPVQVIRGADGQSADILQVRSNDDVVHARISAAYDLVTQGAIITSKNTAPADNSLAANQMAIWFDSTAGASALKIKAKDAAGAIVTGSVPLT